MGKKIKIEYGAMSSKYSIEADNKLTAYVGMVAHFGRNAHLIAIYSPEECREDMWLNPFGKIAKRLDEIFGGEGAFDKYAHEHEDEIKAAIESIKQLV